MVDSRSCDGCRGRSDDGSEQDSELERSSEMARTAEEGVGAGAIDRRSRAELTSRGNSSPASIRVREESCSHNLPARWAINDPLPDVSSQRHLCVAFESKSESKMLMRS